LRRLVDGLLVRWVVALIDGSGPVALTWRLLVPVVGWLLITLIRRLLIPLIRRWLEVLGRIGVFVPTVAVATAARSTAREAVAAAG